MSRIRVDELINAGNTGPLLAVEGLEIPVSKTLNINGSIVLNGDTGLDGQVLRRTTTGLSWDNVPLTDSDTTYTLSAIDGSNAATEKVIRLAAGGSGSGVTDVVLIAGNNVALTRSGDRITIDSSYTDTNTITRIGTNGANYTDGDVNLIGTGAATITQSGRTISINVTDDNTTYTGESGVNITSDNRIRIGQPVGVNDAVTFGQITVTGDLIVQGTTTNSNVVNVSSTDKIIELLDVLIPTDPTANGGGIILHGDTDHTILWSNPDDSWSSSENFNLSLGREYRIDQHKVLDATSLGVDVVDSSLESVGILTTGIWNATPIGVAYGGTGHTTANGALNGFLPQQAGNSGKFLSTDGQDTSWTAIPPTYAGWDVGDATVTKTVNSTDTVKFIGTGNALVTLDNVQNRVIINSTDTTYGLSVENDLNPTKKIIRLTDSTSFAQDVVLGAGTGVTLTRVNDDLIFSVAQDVSASARPTFSALTVTGGIDATSYSGDASSMDGLTGASNGTYGGSAEIPIITVSPSGRITSISTAPNSGTGTSGVVAGGDSNAIQYNSNGSFAGSSKFTYEPSQSELNVKGYIVSDNLQSTDGNIGRLSVTETLKLPSKNNSEKALLNIQEGTLIYNNTSKRIEVYKNGAWEFLISSTEIQSLVGASADFAEFKVRIASLGSAQP